jgi:hypothetical protein
MSPAAEVLDSTYGFVLAMAALGVFREGTRKHWWKFTISLGINSPDARLTKAQKAAETPAAGGAAEPSVPAAGPLRKAS